MTTNAKQAREQHNQAPGAVSAGQVNAWIGNPSPVCIHAKQCGRSVVIEHNGDVYACDHCVYVPNHSL